MTETKHNISKSARRPQRTYTIVMWILSIIFAGFLIGLGNLVIKDLPLLNGKPVSQSDFVDQQAMATLKKNENVLEKKISALRRDVEDAQENFVSARQDYDAEKSSFNSWIKTRSATESTAQNPQVIERNLKIDELKKRERDAQRAVQDAETIRKDNRREIEDIRQKQKQLRDTAMPNYRSALHAQRLRSFLMRLALTLPLLAIGGWMLKTKRESSYWPLYRGFILFTLFAFFVELVPYMPSYGGYVRYGVGIIMIVIASHFIIRSMRKYMARKLTEESRSESERRHSIEYETALKKIAAKTCPGCDRAIVHRESVPTDYCVHCGICLQVKCAKCDHRNISFHRFCLSCGTPSVSEEVENAPA